MESYAIENDYDAYMEGTAGLSVSDWYFGIGLSVLASIFGASSKLAIRKSWLIQKRYEIELDGFQINKNENRSSVELASNTETLLPERYRDRIWRAYLLRCWGMFGMSIMNPICSVLAMNFASPSILAPFSGLTLVWVIVFSGVAVGENPSTSEIGAASLIVMGEVIVAIFGDHTNDKHTTVDEVRASYSDPATILYFVVLAFYVACLFYWMSFAKSPSLKRFAWGSCGGTITGPQNFLKDALTVIKATENYEYPWFFPLLVIFAALTSFVGLLQLTACMKRYDATYSAAAFVGSFVVSASLNAAAHYNTFDALESPVNYVLYPFGILVLMIGVFILERSHSSSQETPIINGGKESEDSKVPYVQVEDRFEGELM